MNHADAPSQSTVRSVSYSTSDTRLYGGFLVLARSMWIAVDVLTVGLFIASLPMLSKQLQTVCVRATSCPSGALSPIGIQTIHELGFSLGGYATYILTLYVATSLVWFVVGVVIFWHKSDDWMALLVALFLVMFNIIPGVGKSLPAFVYPIWDLPLKFLSFLAVIPLGLFFYLFPTGRFVPRWTGWLAVVFVALAVPRSFFPDSPFDFTTWPGGLNVLIFLSVVGTMLFAQLYRYRYVSDPVQCQQTKWVVFGVTTTLVVIIAGELYYLIFPTLSQPGSLYSFFFGTAIPLVLLAIPLSIGIAVLRYRLWDIDVIINRTLVYAILTASIIGIYVFIVGGLGTLLSARSSLIISLLATGLVAVLFQPLRNRLQRSVNRLLYGERDDPYAVLSRLGQRLETALVPDTVLPTIVETIAQALKVPYAAITLQGEGMLTTTVNYGTLRGEPVAFPLVYQGETIGTLLLAPRTPGETFTSKDMHLLTELVRQVGLAAHAVRLTADLQCSNEHLRMARAHLVTAREEERRRLRRDLHDGLGPTLAAITLKVGAARKLLPRDRPAADALLRELNSDIETTVGDIRRLVYNLRPPSLDELGLIEAIRQDAAHSALFKGADQADGLEIVVNAPDSLPPLPAAVEVAVYRIAQEALTNVVRHARAHTCRIRLSLDEMLSLEICDDGVGLAAAHHTGVGIHSMQERALELSGTCVVEPISTGGTRVLARLPISKE